MIHVLRYWINTPYSSEIFQRMKIAVGHFHVLFNNYERDGYKCAISGFTTAQTRSSDTSTNKEFALYNSPSFVRTVIYIKLRWAERLASTGTQGKHMQFQCRNPLKTR
jgi:hypothetical protein